MSTYQMALKRVRQSRKRHWPTSGQEHGPHGDAFVPASWGGGRRRGRNPRGGPPSRRSARPRAKGIVRKPDRSAADLAPRARRAQEAQPGREVAFPRRLRNRRAAEEAMRWRPSPAPVGSSSWHADRQPRGHHRAPCGCSGGGPDRRGGHPPHAQAPRPLRHPHPLTSFYQHSSSVRPRRSSAASSRARRWPRHDAARPASPTRGRLVRQAIEAGIEVSPIPERPRPSRSSASRVSRPTPSSSKVFCPQGRPEATGARGARGRAADPRLLRVAASAGQDTRPDARGPRRPARRRGARVDEVVRGGPRDTLAGLAEHYRDREVRGEVTLAVPGASGAKPRTEREPAAGEGDAAGPGED